MREASRFGWGCGACRVVLFRGVFIFGARRRLVGGFGNNDARWLCGGGGVRVARIPPSICGGIARDGCLRPNPLSSAP